MNLLENLGIHQDLVTKDRVELSMPVQAKHFQPYGIVHGGINTVLAETAASLGANANVAPGRIAVGVNVTTQHIRAIREGEIFVVATPDHVGRTLQTWQARLLVNDRLTATATITLMNVPAPTNNHKH